MNAQYRVRMSAYAFTPQRKFLGLWFDIGPPQQTLEKATAFIKQKLGSSAIPKKPSREKDFKSPRQ